MGNKPISKVQVQLIKIAQKQTGLSDEAYRIVLNELFWVNSCKDLCYDEASKLIDHFKSKGFRIVTKRYERRAKSVEHRAGNIIQLVSPQQLAKIEHLRADIRWHVHDGYFRWLKKWLKKEKVSTSRDANSVIEGLKGMLARQQKAKLEEHNAPEPPLKLRGGQNTGTQETQETQETGLRRDGSFHGGRWQW